ncbi:MAG TPA: hypothetical protein VFU15_01130 [Bacteroidia bacterium]|nr:hypothetical protein [Bacteroidia bacterium]
MTAPNTNLESLINALTSQEQRYFRLFAGRHGQPGDSRYLHLFDWLAKGQNGLEKNGGQTSSASERNYLARMILQSLRVYHDGGMPELELRNLVANVLVLQKKRLMNSCMAELKKAKTLAALYEQYTVLLDLFSIEATMLIERQQKNLANDLEELHREMIAVEKQLEMQQTLFRLSNRIFIHSRSAYHAREEDRRDSITKLMHEAQLIAVPAHSLRLQHLQLKIMAVGAVCLGNFEQAFSCYEKLQQLWEAYPGRIEADKSNYRKVLSNFLVVCHAMGDFNSMRRLLDTIRKLKPDNLEDEAEQFQNVFYLELLYLMNTDGFESLDPLVKEIEAGIQKYATKINKAREFAIYYNIGIAYFLSARYRQAVPWLQRIIDNPKTDHRKDIQTAARLVRLILYYELDKFDTLEYELINVERYLRQRKAWYAYEASVLKMVGKLLSAGTPDKNSVVRKLKDQLTETMSGKTSATLPGLSELNCWMHSKLSGQTMRELLRKQDEARA